MGLRPSGLALRKILKPRFIAFIAVLFGMGVHSGLKSPFTFDQEGSMFKLRPHGVLPLLLCLLCFAAQAQTPPGAPPGSSPSATSPDPNMPRPIAARDSVFIEELTWLEVRDALRAGKTTAIIATGGVEMNGPYLATGKHNYILRATTESIARKLGDALVAPIVPFVPEGDIDPPTGHMRYPGAISVTQETYKRLLTDIASSLRANGFKHVILIGDSGGNQQGMKEVAAELSAKWTDGKTKVHYISEYYDYPGLTKWLASQGVREVDEGHHDDYGITAQMMVVDPNTVRMKERVAAGKFSINSVQLAPADKTIAMGRRAIEFRAGITVQAIKKAVGQ
jgi:creatinine amidohydrolase